LYPGALWETLECLNDRGRWAGDEYYILFSASEIQERSDSYGIVDLLPGFQILGLIGCDDFIVQDMDGNTFKLPTVPCIPKYLEPLQMPEAGKLVTDSRFAGKVKWYAKPIVFGGDPNLGDNLTWITHDSHAASVRWWNAIYREIEGNQPAM
jgi:hypothetical protein